MKCLAGRQDLKRKPGADVLGLRSSVVESGEKLLVGEGLEECDQRVDLRVIEAWLLSYLLTIGDFVDIHIGHVGSW